jgi:hypothetical protein
MPEGRIESFKEYVQLLFKQTEAVMLGLLGVIIVSGILYLSGQKELSTRTTFILGVVGFVAASFEAFHECRIERDKYGEEVRAATLSKPRFEVVGQKFVTLHANNQRLFSVLQLWLCNVPEYRNVHSIAKNVTIRLSFYADNAVTPLLAYSSQWVQALDPEIASYGGRSPYIDVPANDNPAKCIVLLRHDGDANCYAHSFGKLIGNPDGKYQPYLLKPGRYRVSVNLRGDNIDQELNLALKIDSGVPSEPVFDKVPNRSDTAIPSHAADEMDEE